MAILEPPVKTELTFETPEPGAWEAFQALASQIRAGVQLDPSEDIAGRRPSYQS